MSKRHHDSSAGRRRRRIVGQFSALPVEMQRSPAWRVLSLAARRVLDRIMIEKASHGGRCNGKLPVTFANFASYGIERHAIAPAIRELVALGFIEVTREGRAGNAEFRQAACYRLTFAVDPEVEPTHEWRRIHSLDQARMKASNARKAVTSKNRKPVRVSHTEVGGDSPPRADQFSVRETRTTAVGKTTPLSISRAGGRAEEGGDDAPALDHPAHGQRFGSTSRSIPRQQPTAGPVQQRPASGAGLQPAHSRHPDVVLRSQPPRSARSIPRLRPRRPVVEPGERQGREIIGSDEDGRRVRMWQYPDGRVVDL